MNNTPIGRLRIVGLVEGISFLILLLIAMPLKYMAGIPQPVTVVGMLHGVLFCLYVAAIFNAMTAHRWSIVRAAIAFVASIIPFGTFVFDKSLRKEQDAAA